MLSNKNPENWKIYHTLIEDASTDGDILINTHRNMKALHVLGYKKHTDLTLQNTDCKVQLYFIYMQSFNEIILESSWLMYFIGPPLCSASFYYHINMGHAN